MPACEITRELAARARQLARHYDADPEAVVAELLEGQTAVATLFAKVLKAELSVSRRGRKVDPVRSFAIVETARSLMSRGHPQALAFRKAPTVLAEKGILVPRNSVMTADSVRRAYRERQQYYWFSSPTSE